MSRMPESVCCRRGWGFVPWATARDGRGDFSRCWWNGWWQHLHTTTSSYRQPSWELWPSEGEWCWHWLPQFHCLPMVSLCAFPNRPWLSAALGNTRKHVVLWNVCFQSFPTIIWDLFPFEFTALYQFTTFSKGLCYMQECGVERTWVFATGICFGSKWVGRRGNGQPTKGFSRIISLFQQATARATHELGLSLLLVGVETDKVLLPAV